jgi:glycosyltransferase involved in cell wall biosynthesis
MALKKVDLAMWTKNGAETLDMVLKQIGQVIPIEFVNRKLIVDDQSTDNTGQIAKSHNWDVVSNKGKGISDGANTALRFVTSDYFVSFEQDLLLAHDWWDRIAPQIEMPEVAVACGMRFADKPRGAKKLQQYVAKKYRGESEIAPWLRTRQMSAFTLGKTLDNTIYKTRVIRALGGFPKLSVNAGVDTILAYEVARSGYRWVVDYYVQSVHLRHGLQQELRHQYWYATQLYEINRRIENKMSKAPPVTRSGVVYRFLISPFTGLFVAVKMREPSITYIHPLIRLYYMRGLLHAKEAEY